MYPEITITNPRINAQIIPSLDGAAPPVSGRSDTSSGTAVGSGAGEPDVPTATVAGTELIPPHTLAPASVDIRTRLDRTVSVSSALIATMDRPEMFDHNSFGSGMHTSTASFSPYDETLVLEASTAEISYQFPPRV